MGEVLQQLLALVTFFAFPTFQYLLLKRYARRQGDPQLWYLPAHGFRLVVRNIGDREHCPTSSIVQSYVMLFQPEREPV